MKDELHYIRHIYDAILQIEEYLKNSTFDEFAGNAMMRDAVVRQLEIIGEAATKLSNAFKDSHPSIPFAKMMSMRNRMIHEYFRFKMT